MQSIIDTGHSGFPKKRPSAEKTAGFKTMLELESEKNSGKNQDPEAPVSKQPACEKKIEVISDQGVVKLIRVRCSCGEITEIDCEYGE